MAEIDEKTFTQADVDAIVSKRLGEERRKFPNDDEMIAFRSWREKQSAENEKLVSMTAERDTANQRLSEANAEVSKLKHERYLLGKGVSEGDLEYYDFKISKAVNDSTTYEQAAEAFLKERPVQQNSVKIDMSAGLAGGNSARTTSGIMNDLIRKAAKNN